MKIGRFTIEQLSEGFFELFEDGTFQKMNPDRLRNLPEDPTLGSYSSALGIDPVLITDGRTNVVIDPGLGWGLDSRSKFRNTSNIVTNLAIFGLAPEDIDHVIITHLHFDHTAGATFVDDEFITRATFNNAIYHLHRDEWDFAITCELEEKQAAGADYRMDELYKLAAENRIRYQTQYSIDVLPGITVMKTGGHTPGHTVVRIEDEGHTAYYTGDLVPTEYHLNHYPTRQVDTDPIEAKKAKTLHLRKALKQDAILLFYHSLFKKSGKLAIDEKRQYVLMDV